VGAGAAIGGQAGVTYPGIPTGAPDEEAAKFLQDRINEIQNALPTLETDVDNAYIQLDNAQDALNVALANPDPDAEAAARKAVAEARAAIPRANKRVNEARAAQGRYLQQQDQVLRRIEKREARNDPATLQEQQLRVAAAQAQIAENNAQIALANARLQAEFNPESVEAKNELTRAQSELTRAQVGAQQASTAYDNARAAAYPAESAANVGATTASAAANQAQAAQIQALIAAGMPAAQAAQTVAQGRASNAAAAVSEEELRQKQIGELAVLQEQLDKQVLAGTLSRAAARDALQAAVDKLRTGATPYERQQQTAQSSLAFARDAMQAGTLVNMGQPYATGAEPGGAYSRMSEQLGFGPYSQTLNPTPLPKAIQNIGADVNTPYTAAQLGGAPQTLQAGQQMAGGDPRAIQAAGEAAIDWSALTFQQAKALLRGGGGAPTPQVPPQTSVPVMHGGGSVPGPMGV
jgi:hypothetical protein